MCLKRQSHLKSWVLPLGLQLSPLSASLRVPPGLLSHHCSPNLSKGACSEPYLAVHTIPWEGPVRETFRMTEVGFHLRDLATVLGATGDTKMMKMGWSLLPGSLHLARKIRHTLDNRRQGVPRG